MGRHTPVLLREVLEALAIRADGCYVDATFGRGGHTAARSASAEHVATLRRVAQTLHRTGAAGEAAAVQLTADLGRWQGSVDSGAWLAAAEAWSAVDQPFERAHALLHAGECQLAAGDRRAARATLAEARDVAHRLRAAPLTSRIAALAERARLGLQLDVVPSDVAVRVDGLTSREITVLRLVASGCSNPQIAQQLFISPKTAAVHVSHILAKLGLSSRTEAALFAQRIGLLD